jgi:hypothetical protein
VALGEVIVDAPPGLFEPEFFISQGEHCGYRWVVMHNGRGSRCGYLRIPRGHPWHRLPLAKIDARAHGGLNWSAIADDGARWVGFDCEHARDLRDFSLPMPDGLRERLREIEDSFRDRPGYVRRECPQEYVEAECRGLCEQARSAGGGDR